MRIPVHHGKRMHIPTLVWTHKKAEVVGMPPAMRNMDGAVTADLPYCCKNSGKAIRMGKIQCVILRDTGAYVIFLAVGNIRSPGQMPAVPDLALRLTPTDEQLDAGNEKLLSFQARYVAAVVTS